MFTWWFKAGIVLILGLSTKGALQTRKEIRKGNIQWVAWKSNYDSLYLSKRK